VVCECDTVMVCFSLKDQSSALIPEDFRQSIEAYEKGEAQ
jgi:acyl-CoA thioester hydrolase